MVFTKNKRLCLAAFLPILLAIAVFAFAQDYRSNLKITRENSVVTYLSGELPKQKLNTQARALGFLDTLSDIYGFSNVHEEFRLDKTTTNAGGYVLDFDQYYEGVYVYPREIKISVDKDFVVQSISGNYLSDIEPSNSIVIDESHAMEIVKNQCNEAFDARLLVFTYQIEPVYAYEVATSNAKLYVDAQSGEIFKSLSTVRNLATPYTSLQEDYYGEQVEITISLNEDGTYSLVDGYRNLNVRYATPSAMSGTTYSNTTGIFDNKDKNEHVAVTAFNNIIKTFDFYTKEENIGASLYGVNNSVRTDLFGSANEFATANELGEKQVNLLIYVDVGMDNAYCAMNSPNQNFTTIVMGDVRPYGVALDAVSHEYQHAINYNIAGLIYENMSGALDEGLADLFAALVEGNDISSDAFWQIGESLPGGSFLRSAINPTWPYSSTVNNAYPFCYEGDVHQIPGCDFGGVHYNSTIISRSIYLAYKYSEMYDFSVFTTQNLGKILYSTIQKMPSDCTWVQFADLVIDSVDALDISGREKSQLIKAFTVGFRTTGIYSTSNNISTVSFDLGEFHSGILPQSISVTIGQPFTMPNTSVSREGGTLVGWTTEPNNANPSNIYLEGETYTMPREGLKLYPISHIERWDDFEFVKFDGDGSSASPYQISSSDDLAALAYYTNVGIAPSGAESQEISEAYFCLTNDITLPELVWQPIGMYSFMQRIFYFDGAGYTISNLILPSEGEYLGLFAIFGGEIKNLTVEGEDAIVSASAVGSLVGYLDKGRIKNCFSVTNITNIQKDGAAGGIVGEVSSNLDENIITTCYNLGSITSDYAGGIAGRFINSTSYPSPYFPSIRLIGASINAGSISGRFVGGILGAGTNIVFVNCVNMGQISENQSLSRIGGIIGILNNDNATVAMFSAFISCKNSGSITKSFSGTFAGSLAGFITTQTGMSLRFDSNVVERVSGLNASGNAVSNDFKMNDGVRTSVDSSDFDYSSADYWRDSTKWSQANGVSCTDFADWQFSSSGVPVSGYTAMYWDEAVSDIADFGAGNGTNLNPYQIFDAASMALLLKMVNNEEVDDDGVLYSEKHYVVTADIDMKQHLWTGIGFDSAAKTVSFAGSIDGRGYEIYNLIAKERNSDGKLSGAALFSSISGATIKNLRLNIAANGQSGAGGIACRILGSAQIEGCIVAGSITSANGAVGGIAGSAASVGQEMALIVITSSINYSNISAQIAGGILGSAEGVAQGDLEISYCLNRGALADYLRRDRESFSILAGILGVASANTVVTATINSADISSFGGGYVSGIVGLMADAVMQVTISGSKQVGALYSLNTFNSANILSRAFAAYPEVVINRVHFSDSAVAVHLHSQQMLGSGESQDILLDSFAYYSNENNFGAEIDIARLFVLQNSEDGFGFATFVSEGSVVDVQKVELPGLATEPNEPVKPSTAQHSFSFVGWSGEIDGSIVDSFEVEGDVSFYAVFSSQIRSYSVSFRNVDGTEISNTSYQYGDAVSMPAPTKEGYTFGGWYLDVELSQQAQTVTVEGETILYAKWVAEEEEPIVDEPSCACATLAFTPTSMIICSFLLLVLCYCIVAICIQKQKAKRQ